MRVRGAGRGRTILQRAERILGHLAAVVVGFALMVIGLGLGVTMIMLPVGLLSASQGSWCSYGVWWVTWRTASKDRNDRHDCPLSTLQSA